LRENEEKMLQITIENEDENENLENKEKVTIRIENEAENEKNITKYDKSSKDKENDEKYLNEDQINNKKIPYDLRNKSLEKISNFYNEKIMETVNFKNEYDFSIFSQKFL